MKAHPKPAKAIFLEAVERYAPEQWPAFLDRACAGQPELRSCVEALLAAHQAIGTAGPADASPVATVEKQALGEGPGTVLGPYQLLEQIGEGGFGVVFLAEQTQPIRRKVALKVLKPGMDTRQVVARFKTERQALALMEHPNIAQIHDGGTTPDGRPFFVMELVKGVPITAYCDRCSLTTRERLALFLSVCQAVQHAHQKGVIHRDLKPSNVLVAIQDGKPAVKVIDFGIAKALNQRLSEQTLATGFHQLIGTPLYMSPEQAELRPLDVDTRADIYTLGVLLYELLTGTTPLEKERLTQAGYDELRRLIREEEPPPPSARLSTLQDQLTAVAAQRRTEPRQLRRTVRGELDWIVMKCLEKDRNRRYETANGLAQDIESYLKDEPVQACPPSTWYRAWKFARRHRSLLAFTGAALLCLALLGAGLGWAAGDRAARRHVQEKEANDALAQAAQYLEEGKLPEATAWAQRAEGVLAGGADQPACRQRLQAIRADLDMVDRLQEIRIRQSQVRNERFDITAADAEFAQAFREYGIDVEALNVAQAAAAIRARPIRLELVLALDDWGFVHPKRPRNAKDPWHLLAVARAADDDSFRNRLRQALEKQPIDRPALERLAVSDELAKLRAPTFIMLEWSLRKAGAVDTAIKVLSRAVRRYPSNVWVNEDLAFCLAETRPPRWQEALPFFMAARALRPQSPGVCLNLGIALAQTGDKQAAITTYQEAIDLKPDYATPYLQRGNAYHALHRNSQAIADYTKAIELKPDYAHAWVARSIVYGALGQKDKAIADCTEALRLDPNDAGSWYNRGMWYSRFGQHEKAVADYSKALKLKPDFFTAWMYRGFAYRDLHQWDKALADFSKASAFRPTPTAALNSLAWLLATCPEARLRDPRRAVELATKATQLRPKQGTYWNTLGIAHYRAGNPKEAVAALEKSMELRQGGNGQDWFFLAMAHWQLGNKDQAQRWYGQAAEWMEKNAPQNEDLRRFAAEAAELMKKGSRGRSQESAKEPD